MSFVIILFMATATPEEYFSLFLVFRTVESVLKKEESTLWDILRCNDCLDEVKFDNSKLINRLATLESFRKLVMYIEYNIL